MVIATAPLVLGAGAQQPANTQSTTFTAPGGAFHFSYPRNFQVCTKGKIQSCVQSFIPVCEEDSLVCVAYPAAEFKNTSFEAAAFQVREIFREENMTADVCVTPYPRRDGGTVTDWPEFLISAKHPVEMIGGVQFLHGINGGAATSHSIGIDLYRALYRDRCFELSISEAATEPHVTDPPMKTLTAAQQKELDRTMSDILHSFRFTE
jgi:hypothetical protein